MEPTTEPTLPPNVGPLTPQHRKGHCQFNPLLDGKDMCNAPATIHFWVGDETGFDGIDAFTSYSCDDHWAAAQRLVSPIDWHPVEQACIESGTMWRWSTEERRGFCHHGEGADVAAAVAELPLSTGVAL